MSIEEGSAGEVHVARPAHADVAVVGGGLVGAAAALAAAQAGFDTRWFVGPGLNTPAAADARDLRVYALGPATRRFLDRLGVWSRLDDARLAPVLDMRIFADRHGTAALHFGAYESATDRLATIVEHGALARAFDAAIVETRGVVRVDTLVDATFRADERVALTARPGDQPSTMPGGDERSASRPHDVVSGTASKGAAPASWTADLVVAADGARSAVRDAAGIGTRGRPYAQRAIVGNFACARTRAGTAFQWFTDDGVIALLPLASGTDAAQAMSLVWSAPDDVAEALVREGADAVAARLTTLVAASSQTAIGPLAALGALAAIPLSLQWATRLVAPRAALVGDAAHVVHPLAGQGLNLGFGDVEALVDVLAGKPSFRDCGDATLLRRYERARAEPVLAMRHVTDGLARLFANERIDVAKLRALGMRALEGFAPGKRFLMRQAAGQGAAGFFG